MQYSEKRSHLGIVWVELIETRSRRIGVVCQWLRGGTGALVGRLVVHQHDPQFIVKPKSEKY